MAAIDSLLVNLGFDVKTDGAQKYEKSLKSVRNVALGLTASISALGFAIFETSKRFAEGAEDIELSAQRAGLSTRAYQELGGAAAVAGVNQDQFTNSLQQFNVIIGQASLGMGAGLQAFARLGIGIRNSSGGLKSTEQLLGQVADHLEGLSQARQISIAQQLGFTAQSVQLLLQGSGEIRKLRKEVSETGVVISKKGIETGARFADQLKLVGLQVQGVKQRLGEALLPTTEKLLSSFEKWLKVNQKIIDQDLKTIFTAVANALGFLSREFSKILSIVKLVLQPLGGLNNVLAALAITVAGIFVIEKLIAIFTAVTVGVRALTAALITMDLAAIPIEALVGLVAALAIGIGLVIDDIRTFARGGDSVLGRLVKKFALVKAIVDDIALSFRVFISGAKAAFGFAQKVSGISGRLFSNLKQSIQRDIGVNVTPSALSQSGLSNFVPSSIAPILNLRPDVSTSPLRPTTNAPSTTNLNATFNISESLDSQKTANVITDHLNQMARQTQRNLSNPVRT